MNEEKITEITIETERVFRVACSFRPLESWCAKCGEIGLMLKPEQANAVSGLSVLAICRRADAGELHFIETPDGMLFVCLNSLMSLIEPEN